jgi:hypothetical protein
MCPYNYRDRLVVVESYHFIPGSKLTQLTYIIDQSTLVMIEL